MGKSIIVLAVFAVSGCTVDPPVVDVTGPHVYFMKDALRCAGFPEVEYENSHDGYLYAQTLENYGDYRHWNTEGLPSGEYRAVVWCRRRHDAHPSEIHFAPAQDSLDDESREWFVYGGEYPDGWEHRSFWHFAGLFCIQKPHPEARFYVGVVLFADQLAEPTDDP
jgi:hypothetical protein